MNFYNLIRTLLYDLLMHHWLG